MVRNRLPTQQLHRSAAALDNHLLGSLIAAALPVPLAIALGLAYQTVIPGTEYGVIGKNISYGLASLLVLGGVYMLFSTAERAAAFQLERPTQQELTWALLGFPIGTALYLGATTATQAIGLTMTGYEYTLSDPLTVGAVIFGAVLVSPLAEELLFRGLVVGTLLGRGIHPILAGGLGILAFALIHLPLLGVAGVLTMSAWAIVPTTLRLHFDNLSGAWMVHQLNNIWGYIIVVALGLG